MGRYRARSVLVLWFRFVSTTESIMGIGSDTAIAAPYRMAKNVSVETAKPMA
jgi:hypothetical protein